MYGLHVTLKGRSVKAEHVVVERKELRSEFDANRKLATVSVLVPEGTDPRNRVGRKVRG